jgi:Ran GTPase-activating protein (RanGAP) involved in mRNA processing and transport
MQPTTIYNVTMTTSKRNNFAVDLADLERKLASNITSTFNTRWNPPASQHHQSATTMTTPNIAVTSPIAPTPTITHCVTKWTPPETVQHDGVLVGEQHNAHAPVASAMTPQRDNTPKHNSNWSVKCITRYNKALQDENLDEIIKEVETSTVLMEVNLCRNQITLADGRFTTALTSNTSLLKINLPDNNISDEGVRHLAGSLKVNNTLRCINLSENHISKAGAKFLAEALMVNKMLENLYLNSNKIGDEGVRSLAMALQVNSTLKLIDLSGCQISKVGAKFLADALMVNTSLVAINLSCNNINDEGAQILAESFTVNQSLRNIQLCNNKITDIGATKVADSVRFRLNVDCGVTTINLKGNQVSASLLSMIQSICKAQQSSMSKELSSSTTHVQQSTPLATPHHDGVLAGEQHNASGVNAVTQSKLYNTTENDTALVRSLHFRLKQTPCFLGLFTPCTNSPLVNVCHYSQNCNVNINCEHAKDEDFNEIIKNLETNKMDEIIKRLEDNKMLENIRLSFKSIGDDGAKRLCVALKVNNTLVTIDLSRNQISTAGAKHLAEALMVNNTLESLNLNTNMISNEGAQSLGDALKVNKTLVSINLGINQISKVGAKYLAEMFMTNKMLEDMNLNANRIGDEGVRSLATALQANKTLKFIDLSGCRVSKVGAKFLAEALMENTSLVVINLSGNNINDEGAQSLAESFTENRSLRIIQLINNKITDIGATQLADAIEFNCDSVLTTINLKGNQVSIGLLDRIESISKAKESSKGKELSLNGITQIPGQKAKDRKRKRKLQIVDSNASKDDQIASLKEHIALLEKDIARLNDTLKCTKPTVETIDLTTDEAERETKRSRTESDVKSNLAIMYEQNQKIVQIKQENVATQLVNHTVMSTFKELRGEIEDAHAILHEQTQRVIHIKKEKMDTEVALESVRGEKNLVEADLKVVKEDLEDANELVGQMSLTTDIWQGRFDELVALVESGHADGASINAIRNRPLASGM